MAAPGAQDGAVDRLGDTGSLILHIVITALVLWWSGIWSAWIVGRELSWRTNQLSNESAVEIVVLQTHPQFAEQFIGANDDIEQAKNLLAHAIEQLLESFSGMHRLIEIQKKSTGAVLQQQSNSQQSSDSLLQEFMADTAVTLQSSGKQHPQ